MSVVVYSALYGTKEPANADVFGPFTSCRRVLFTDRSDLSLPGVDIVVDPLDGLDPARASRRAKLMPHRYLAEDWSIWLDNKSSLRRDPAEVIAALQAQSDAAFFAFPHFRRDCVYQEGQAVCENGLDDHRIVRERMETYAREGMPRRLGLIEGHFLVRRHGDPEVARFGDRWFEHVLRHSRRDQISFPYLAWRMGLRYDLITALDWNETVEFDRIDRRHRKPDFPRRNRTYQALRALYHGLKRR